MALAPSNRGELSAPCGVEAKVSIERMGPKGTSAGDRPGSFGITIAVTLRFSDPAGRLVGINLRRGRDASVSNRLPCASKKVR
jgi:hypothetical protein